MPEKNPIIYYKELEAPAGYELSSDSSVEEVNIEDYNQMYEIVYNNKKKVSKFVKVCQKKI